MSNERLTRRQLSVEIGNAILTIWTKAGRNKKISECGSPEEMSGALNQLPNTLVQWGLHCDGITSLEQDAGIQSAILEDCSIERIIEMIGSRVTKVRITDSGNAANM